MPIVDGLTSTKMIRSFEKTHTGDIYSPRAALCGRVPIIAVSASLIEKSMPNYVAAGFDAWILKPISFDRLSQLLTAIVNPDIRRNCLYQPGQWEKGGWFHTGPQSPDEVSTAPSGRIPQSGPTRSAEIAASSENPTAGDSTGVIPEEQERLLQVQGKGKGKGKQVHYETGDDTSASDTPTPSESTSPAPPQQAPEQS